MSDVFISYKAEDRSRVRPLVEALEADGLSVWWDAHIGGGDEWRETIARHLDEARCVIVVWSKRSVGPEGRFVRDEATRALRRGAYLPVRIDKVEPPLGFGETQALPLNGWKGDRSDPRYLAVAKDVRSITGLEPDPHRRPQASPSIGRRPLLVGGAAAVVTAGLGGWLLLRPDEARANSIAVLPFANLSGDPGQAYFSDGMAEELRSALSRIAGLKVVARTSSEMVRDSDAKSAARKLGVEHIVSGSVRRSPSTIRVNAQLVGGNDGLERWSQTFDRPAGDLLEIQTSIAENVAQALSVQLANTDREVLTLGGTHDPAAQDLYLRSFSRQSDTKDALNEAVGLVNGAIALDPNFAQAHSRKAFIVSMLAAIYALSREESARNYRVALESVQRALAIEPRLANAYATRGSIFRDNLDMRRAMADLERADALPGEDAHALRIHGIMLAQSRRFEEALQKIGRANALDPLNPVSLEAEALVLVFARRYPEGVAAARRSLSLTPNRLQAHRLLANTLMLQGKDAEARSEYSRLDPTDYRRLVGEAMLAARAGDRATALSKLRDMERRYGDAATYQYCQVYAQLNMPDEAISALHRAVAARDPGVPHIQVDPFLDPIRRDPRFGEIVAKLNFPSS